MLTEQDFENVKIGDIIEVAPNDEDSYLSELCKELGISTYTAPVIGRGIDPENGSTDLFISCNCPGLAFPVVGVCDAIVKDDEEEFSDDAEYGKQYIGVGFEIVKSMLVVGHVGGSKSSSSNDEERGGLSYL